MLPWFRWRRYNLLPATSVAVSRPSARKKPYPVYLDASALAFPFISVSAGQRGMQVFLAPGDLITVVSAQTADLV